MRALILAAAVALTACGPKQVMELAPSMVPEPAPADVESVIFLFGDAGYADLQRNPVLSVLRSDIERWSGALDRDSSVAVLFLGDIIYPRGLHDSNDSAWPRDSLSAESQAALLGGPNARRSAFGIFIAGNHDWGNAKDAAGVARLQNLEQFMERRRNAGIPVRLLPEAGEPGPAVVDIGTQARLLLFDTAWWLLADSDEGKRRSFQQTEDVLRTTRNRFTIVAAHHPFRSAASHGGLVPFWKAFGLRFLLNRSGALLQDLNSVAYRELTNSMLEAFRAGPPLLFAGGHDHNLQVIRHIEHPWPRWSIVSGSGSKVSDVGHIDGMTYRAAAPGYMRVIIQKNGRVDLFVVNADDEHSLGCDGDADAIATCMAEHTAKFTTRYGVRLQ